jgi:hypothetical protein
MTKTRAVTAGIIIGLAWAAGAAGAAPRAQPVAVACRNVPEAESHLAVLLSPDDVLRVDALTAHQQIDDPTVPPGEGARIFLAAQPFVTALWLEQAIECHVARNAASGHAAASRSPLDVDGARFGVTSAPGTLIVAVTTDDPRAAREILTRARALAPAR